MTIVFGPEDNPIFFIAKISNGILKQSAVAPIGKPSGKNGVVRNEKPDDVIAVLFKGVSNPITLRKRYKELLKIFHPDNLCGDEEMVQLINREYERRKRAEQKPV